VNKQELVEKVAKETGFTKTDAAAALESVLKTIAKGAKKESVQLVGFGTFKTVARKARNGVNPSTGAKIRIAAKKVFKFSASKNPKY